MATHTSKGQWHMTMTNDNDKQCQQMLRTDDDTWRWEVVPWFDAILDLHWDCIAKVPRLYEEKMQKLVLNRGMGVVVSGPHVQSSTMREGGLASSLILQAEFFLIVDLLRHPTFLRKGEKGDRHQTQNRVLSINEEQTHRSLFSDRLTCDER